jgi:hypothetical protein
MHSFYITKDHHQMACCLTACFAGGCHGSVLHHVSAVYFAERQGHMQRVRTRFWTVHGSSLQVVCGLNVTFCSASVCGPLDAET